MIVKLIFQWLYNIIFAGFIVDFISVPVTLGFTGAATITIGSSQIRSLFGLRGSGNEFLETWISVFKYITDIKLYDTLLGITTIILLLLLKVIPTFGRFELFNYSLSSLIRPFLF